MLTIQRTTPQMIGYKKGDTKGLYYKKIKKGYTVEYDDYIDITGNMRHFIDNQNVTDESYINGFNEFNYEEDLLLQTPPPPQPPPSPPPPPTTTTTTTTTRIRWMKS